MRHRRPGHPHRRRHQHWIAQRKTCCAGVSSRTAPSAIDRPACWLAGFALVRAEPGATVTARIGIEPRPLEHWSTDEHTWSGNPARSASESAPAWPTSGQRSNSPHRASEQTSKAGRHRRTLGRMNFSFTFP
ncbi:fibronectin type III-like domain-contianing protein [Nocardia sp. NPDC056611]|uniref:fibronectin type III-like domain-contianing protein n=1 Tax=Nocardia sp. NPDC056611 TaxID=3345877 RepID=UPI003672B426